jgi:dihydroxy-acid dehydratase
VFDVKARRLDVELDDDEIARRVAAYESPPSTVNGGVLGKYARHVGSAAQGAVTS